MSNPFQSTLDRNRRLMENSPGIPRNNAYTDDYLISTLVSHGNPRWSAEQLRNNPNLRLVATQFAIDVEDASRGDRSAKQRVDYITSQWNAARREELLADDPSRMHTDHIIDPSTLL